MPIEDIQSVGYSNLGESQGASEPTKEETKPTETPAPQDTEDETPKESGTLENDEETDESDEDSDTQSEEQNPKGDEKPRKKNGFEKRVQKLTKRAQEAAREAQYWKDLALKNQQTQTQPEAQKPQVNLSSDDKPKPEQFEDYADYVVALSDWRYEQKKAEDERKSAASSYQQTLQEKVESHNKRITEAKKHIEDFDLTFQEFVADHPGFKPNEILADVVMSSEHSAEIAYELFKNPDQLLRLNQSSPAVAAKEIGRIEARIERIKEERAKLTTQKTKTAAPQPLAPLGSSNAMAGIQKRPDQMNGDEYLAHRKQQRKGL